MMIGKGFEKLAMKTNESAVLVWTATPSSVAKCDTVTKGDTCDRSIEPRPLIEVADGSDISDISDKTQAFSLKMVVERPSVCFSS
jgi:hypothetical protein